MRSPYPRRFQDSFNRREVEILGLIRQGFSNDAIAQQLSLSVGTVKWYNRQIFSKLGVESRVQAIEKAIQIGLIDTFATQRSPVGGPSQPVIQAKNNLPAPLSAFIGRKNEKADLCRMLQATMPRLVTLLGPGGIGKTRLALQVAEELLPAFAHGVWLVDLSPLADAGSLDQFVAHSLGLAFGIRETPGFRVEELLVRYLRPRALLLVLDNCEHLAEGCARLGEHLLTGCPSLRILATSREALRVEGEALYPLQPMPFPDPEHLPEFQAVKEYDAVRLFVERARLAFPGFSLMPGDAQAVAWICKRLDGIPLALELAAARSGLLSVEQIAAGLADCFHLLAAKGRNAIPHHQTMRASLDWSYDLLLPEERQLLRRLSVFAGGWTLEAAESICAADPADGLDLLNSLVNKSMVVGVSGGPGKAGGLPRYRLLEPVRQYALEKLEQSREAQSLRDQHLTYFARVAEREGPKLYTGESSCSFRLLRSDLDNIRAALGWALGEANGGSVRAELGLRLAAELSEFWPLSGLIQEGHDWIVKALASTSGRGSHLDPVRALAMRVLGLLACFLHDPYEANRLLNAAVALLRGSGDEKNLALALTEKAKWTIWIDKENAWLAIEEGVALARQVQDAYVLPNALLWRGWVKENLGIEQGRLEDFQESLQRFLEAGNLQSACYALVSLGGLALNRGDLALALRYRDQFLQYLPEVEDESLHHFAGPFLTLSAYRQSACKGNCQAVDSVLEQFLEKSRGQNILWSTYYSHWLGIVLKCQGKDRQAAAQFLESLTIAQEMNESYIVRAALAWLAGIAARLGSLQAAARLSGAVEALSEAYQEPLFDLDLEEFQRNVAALREALPEPDFSRAWTAGRSLTEAEAIREGREVTQKNADIRR